MGQLAPRPAGHAALPAVARPDVLAAFPDGRNPRTLAASAKGIDDFARFVGSPSAAAARELLLGLAHGEANSLALGYRAHLADRSLKAATIARRLAALKRAVRRARLVGMTPLHLETEPPKTGAMRDVAGPGAAGWNRMLERAKTEAATGSALGARNLGLILLLLNRALRRGEAVALDYPGDVHLQRPAVNVLGKGRASKEWLTVNDRTRDAGRVDRRPRPRARAAVRPHRSGCRRCTRTTHRQQRQPHGPGPSRARRPDSHGPGARTSTSSYH